MKNSKRMPLLLLMLVIFSSFSLGLKAQCFTIVNDLGCQLDGTLDIYTYVNPPSGPCNGSACTSNLPWSAGPNGGSYPANCGQCSPVCNVYVTVTNLNSSPITSVTADFSTTSPIPLTGLTGLCPGVTSANIVYDPSTNTFRVY